MTDASSRVTWGVLGVIVGFLLSAAVFWAQALQPFHEGLPNIGMPEVFLMLPLLFGAFWIVLIALAIRWLFNPRGRHRERLADLPADFDDWHRRAHAQMDREAAARAGGAQP